MWKTFLSKREESEITVSVKVLNDSKTGWVVNYKCGPNKKDFINNVPASFEFKNEKLSKTLTILIYGSGLSEL